MQKVKWITKSRVFTVDYFYRLRNVLFLHKLVWFASIELL